MMLGFMSSKNTTTHKSSHMASSSTMLPVRQTFASAFGTLALLLVNFVGPLAAGSARTGVFRLKFGGGGGDSNGSKFAPSGQGRLSLAPHLVPGDGTRQQERHGDPAQALREEERLVGPSDRRDFASTKSRLLPSSGAFEDHTAPGVGKPPMTTPVEGVSPATPAGQPLAPFQVSPESALEERNPPNCAPSAGPAAALAEEWPVAAPVEENAITGAPSAGPTVPLVGEWPGASLVGEDVSTASPTAGPTTSFVEAWPGAAPMGEYAPTCSPTVGPTDSFVEEWSGSAPIGENAPTSAPSAGPTASLVEEWYVPDAEEEIVSTGAPSAEPTASFVEEEPVAAPVEESAAPTGAPSAGPKTSFEEEEPVDAPVEENMPTDPPSTDPPDSVNVEESPAPVSTGAPSSEPAAPVVEEHPVAAPVEEITPVAVSTSSDGTAAPAVAPTVTGSPMAAPEESSASTADASPTESMAPAVEESPSASPEDEGSSPSGPPAVVSAPDGTAGPTSPTLFPDPAPVDTPVVDRDLPATASPSSPPRGPASTETVVIPGTVAAGAVSALLVLAAILAAIAGAAQGGGDTGGQGAGNSATSGAHQNPPSARAPSATLGVVAVTQLQFLGTLSLVDDVGTEDSSLSGFAESFRWVNLWPPASFAEEFIGTSEEGTTTTRRLQGVGEGDGGVDYAECSWDDADLNGLGALVFVGNSALVFGALLVVFLVHVIFVSGVEAFWLAKKRAQQEVAMARCREAQIGECLGGHGVDEIGRRQLQPQTPENSSESFSETNSTAGSLSSSQPRPPRRRIPAPPLNAAMVLPNQRRPTRGSPLGGSGSSSSGSGPTTARRGVKAMTEGGETKDAWSGDHVDEGEYYTDGGAYAGHTDGEEEGELEEQEGYRPRAEGQLDPVAECRKHSRSVWLHFPHVELVVLFFAFEGAVASQVSALREGGCSPVMTVAAVALLLYPVVMFVGVVRTVFVRVRPDALVVFTPKDDASSGDAGGDVERGTGAPKPGFLSRVKAGWEEDGSLLAWANKGAWETAETADEETRREAEWFRIGFEPLFVDFTKAGAWFVTFTLFEWAALGCIGALIDESVTQLSLFCGLHSLSFFLLVVLKPLANSVANAMAACIVGIDAICMALLAIATSWWEETPTAQRVDTTVMALQLFALCALIVPIYVDTSLGLLRAVQSRVRKSGTEAPAVAPTEAEKQEERFVRNYVCRAWIPTWCAMLRHNAFACATETREGVRPPRSSRVARDRQSTTK